jgi:hypothetical protein
LATRGHADFLDGARLLVISTRLASFDVLRDVLRVAVCSDRMRTRAIRKLPPLARQASQVALPLSPHHGVHCTPGQTPSRGILVVA